jgi:hypothetical protein
LRSGKLISNYKKSATNLNEQKVFLDKYFSSGKLFRKSPFYKYTWMGIPIGKYNTPAPDTENKEKTLPVYSCTRIRCLKNKIMKKYESTIQEIISLIESWEPKLSALSEEIITERRNSQNRTIKQILGHLIDSNSNNIHRVVHLQYQSSPLIFPNYATFGNNDRWIAIQDYQNEDWNVLIQLWKYSLLHFCHVIKNIDDSKLENEWIAGPERNITLNAMVEDFPKHLKLHLCEINDLIER